MQETWDHWCFHMEIHQLRGANPGGFDSLVMSRHGNVGRVSPKTSPQKPTNPCETWDLPKISHQPNASGWFKQIISPNSLSPVITFTAPPPHLEMLSVVVGTHLQRHVKESSFYRGTQHQLPSHTLRARCSSWCQAKSQEFDLLLVWL